MYKKASYKGREDNFSIYNWQRAYISNVYKELLQSYEKGKKIEKWAKTVMSLSHEDIKMHNKHIKIC